MSAVKVGHTHPKTPASYGNIMNSISDVVGKQKENKKKPKKRGSPVWRFLFFGVLLSSWFMLVEVPPKAPSSPLVYFEVRSFQIPYQVLSFEEIWTINLASWVCPSCFFKYLAGVVANLGVAVSLPYHEVQPLILAEVPPSSHPCPPAIRAQYRAIPCYGGILFHYSHRNQRRWVKKRGILDFWVRRGLK